MATSLELIEYICEQLKGTGKIRYKKMFGEYLVYVNDKPIVTVCDNTVFVKILPEIEKMMKSADKGYPYEGAKEHYILDIDNGPFSREVIAMIEKITPIPKPKVKKNAKNNEKKK